MTDEPNVNKDQATGASDKETRPEAPPADQASPADQESAGGPPAAEPPAGDAVDADAGHADTLADTTELAEEPASAVPVDTAAEPADGTEAPVEGGVPPPHVTAELEALRADLDERTRDLQRVTAEYANYRKRVERDRNQLGEQATANVLSALLPVLDDLDRARDHGELSEGVAAIAEHLVTITGKFGLTVFGEKGEPFDPNRHEAVAHQTSPDVTEPTCVDIMRRGYLLGDRLLRPAMVAVADPE